MKLLFLGGDARMRVAYNKLKDEFSLSSYGLFEGDNGKIECADVIILPVPATRDKINVNCPLTNKIIPLSDVEKSDAFILTCGYKFDRKNQIDYGALDEFCFLNAIATAEGAICTAIENTKTTLFDSKILVTGFGRVGKILASRLSPFCKELTISARSERDIAFITAIGKKAIKTENVPNAATDFDIIFNTLDVPLFKNDSNFKSTLLFDLSTSGCAEENISGLKVIKLPGLPGKTAPVSAGNIIADTVSSIIRREF